MAAAFPTLSRLLPRRISRRAARVLVCAVILSVVCVGLLFLAQVWVMSTGSDGRYHRITDVPAQPVAIVFGAGVHANGSLSSVLEERVRAGVELYHAGKVRKLLMTGDNGRPDYDEVTAMKLRAVKLGVPARDVVRDFAGFRTYDSCYRARDVFAVDRAVLVTQAFHLGRALFLARRLGIEAVGYVAEPGLTEDMVESLKRREDVARVSAALDVLTGRRPKFLGRKEPLFEDERDDR